MKTEHTNLLLEASCIEIENNFLKKVLIPYHEHCQYLKNALMYIDKSQGTQGLVVSGDFGITDSCYIEDTGHFNAVEFNICYNQLAYTYLGYCINNNLIPELAGFKGDTFFEKQLSHFLIAKITSSYKTEINAQKFKGELGINTITRKSKCTFINTYCNFYDERNGKSTGEITLAVLHP